MKDKWYLGVDTSNYTTSLAGYLPGKNQVILAQKALPVAEGAAGVRQSEALFHHTKQLSGLVEELFSRFNGDFSLAGVAASITPRPLEGSYMPCFLAGESVARSIASSTRVPFFPTSHQAGHILAALYGSQKLEIISEKQEFLAFHVSGGTTDCVSVRPGRTSDDIEKIINIKEYSSSLDLKAGQLVDRVGIMLGMTFPCGQEMESVATSWCIDISKNNNLHEKNKIDVIECLQLEKTMLNKYNKKFSKKFILNGANCSLSGIQNQCELLHNMGAEPGEVSFFCLFTIYKAVNAMAKEAFRALGAMPIVFSGGVMSNLLIQSWLRESFPDACFSLPQFSRDNGAGAAIWAYLSEVGLDVKEVTCE